MLRALWLRWSLFFSLFSEWWFQSEFEIWGHEHANERRPFPSKWRFWFRTETGHFKRSRDRIRSKRAISASLEQEAEIEDYQVSVSFDCVDMHKVFRLVCHIVWSKDFLLWATLIILVYITVYVLPSVCLCVCLSLFMCKLCMFLFVGAWLCACVSLLVTVCATMHVWNCLKLCLIESSFDPILKTWTTWIALVSCRSL